MNPKLIISPSIASSNLLVLKDEIDYVDKFYGHIHIDIEDGNFVPNITFGTKLLKQICSYSKSRKSIHLMVTNPLDYINCIKECNVDIVFIHVENLSYPSEVINKYKEHNINVGLAFNPKTQIIPYEYVFKNISGILIMMCEPDNEGQNYIPSMVKKIRKAIKYKIPIWIDGGIKDEMLSTFKDIGVKNVVMGRAIFNRIKDPI